MINSEIENSNNETLITFYDGSSKIGYCILTDNDYIEWFETLIEGVGYAKKMLNELKLLGYDCLEGDALEKDQKRFWEHVGAKFSIGSHFEITL